MKRYITLIFLLCNSLIFCQKREMSDYFLKGNFDKAIETAKDILKSDPSDFDAIIIAARAENEKGNFKNAIPYLENAKSLMKEDFQKAWTLLEMAKSNFGIGNIVVAKQNYIDALKINGTNNSTKALKRFGMISGLDEFYKDWRIVESKNLIFHFENNINENDIGRILKTRQQAYEEINLFFQAYLPKKIDFFVWNQKESYNPGLNKNLGFSDAVFCIAHNRINQTPGHEIAHNISFWVNHNNSRNKFINEGIGVFFDMQKNDKLKIAQEIYKKNPVDIKEIWKTNSKSDDEILYPIAGAFVEYLIKYDKEKFLKLASNQSYENAYDIYNGQIDDLIKSFILKLKE